MKLWEDQEERIVEIPEDVLEVFEKNKDAFEMYQKCLTRIGKNT